MKALSDRDERTLRFAKSELRRVLRRVSLGEMAGQVQFELVGRIAEGPLQELKDDGFAIVPEAGGYRVLSRCMRGLVYGTYGLLESLGCRWYFPGEEGECLPERPAAPPPQTIIENPHTRYRSIVAFWDRTGPGKRERVRENLDFAVRARYNRCYLHWPTDLAAISKQARDEGHGLDIGIKLHTARQLLPTPNFGAHPEWFRLQDGKRTRKYNLCVSNAQALAEVTRNAQRLAESYPIDNADLAYWQDDVPNAWCQCASCAGLSPSEQNLRLMKAILKGVHAAHPRGRLSYLAYYATVAPPESAIPKDMFLEFAPHASCYRHAIDDPRCPKNSALVANLKRSLERFDLSSARVFEYWLDMALFSFYRPPVRRLPLLLERMAHDISFYRGHGIPEIENVQWMLPREAAASPVAANPGFAFVPRLLWNPRQDIGSVVHDFAANFYGDGHAADVLDLVARADQASPRYTCTPDERGDGPKVAAGLLAQAVTRCRELEEAASGRYRQRLTGLKGTLEYDLDRARAGEA